MIPGPRGLSAATAGRRRSLGVSWVWARWLCIGALVSPLTTPLRAQDSISAEYEVKALWLANCARFVEWPERAFGTVAQSPFVVGVLGKDPFGKHLEKAFEGKVVKGHPVVLKRLSGDLDPKFCHILFVAGSERKRMPGLLSRLRGAPVLTVGETDNFLEQGGMVQFVRKQGAIRFAVNLEPAQDARLYVGANLLKVAVSVRGKYE